MKKHLLAIISLLCASAGRCDVLFHGYMTGGSGSKFVISIDERQTSGWLALGQEFGGYSITAFDPKTETLKVSKDGATQTLHLTDAKVSAAAPKPAQTAAGHITISVGTDEAISVGDDAAMLATLKRRFSAAAALDPQPTITIRAHGDVSLQRLSIILDLCRTTGLKRINLSESSGSGQ